MKTKICPICGREYEGYGHNAYPVTLEECCNECNSVVMEMRLLLSDSTENIDALVKDILKQEKNRYGRIGFYGTESWAEISTLDNVYPVRIQTFYTNGVFKMYCFSEYPYTKQFQDTLNNYLNYKYNITETAPAYISK